MLFTSASTLLTWCAGLVSSEEGEMAIFQYVNEEHELAQVVVGGHKVDEVPRNDLSFFEALPGEELEVYARDRPRGPRRLVESGKVSEVASRVRLI